MLENFCMTTLLVIYFEILIITFRYHIIVLINAGVAQLVERQPSKLNVAGSNPVSRSIMPLGIELSRKRKLADVAQG